MAAPADFVVLGRIRGAHGVRGEVKIASYAAPPEGLFTYALTDASGIAFALTRTGLQKDGFLCRIAGVSDRNAAEALKGKELGVPRNALPPAPEGAHYVADLIGCAVEAENGQPVGVVVDIVNYGASDIVVMRTPEGGELMLPYAAQFFPHPPKDGRWVCALPETLSATP